MRECGGRRGGRGVVCLIFGRGEAEGDWNEEEWWEGLPAEEEERINIKPGFGNWF